MIDTAATDLTGIESTLSAANAAASGWTTEVLAAGADQVSAAISALFSNYGQVYQALSAQAATFHDRFVRAWPRAPGVMPVRRPLPPRPCRTRSMPSTLELATGPSPRLLAAGRNAKEVSHGEFSDVATGDQFFADVRRRRFRADVGGRGGLGRAGGRIGDRGGFLCSGGLGAG
ncbi:PE family protein [Mycobacterium basiliense]